MGGSEGGREERGREGGRGRIEGGREGSRVYKARTGWGGGGGGRREGVRMGGRENGSKARMEGGKN